MRELADGYRRFRQTAWAKYRPLFETLVRQGQHPRALWITCADSRVTPDLFTDSRPGDLFIIKNIGNIVPPARAASHSVGAAIEYAVLRLHVPHIVVCGHTGCGAMRALLDDHLNLSAMPHLSEWLRHAITLSNRVPANAPERLTALAEENVRLALQNLLTYPPVREAVANDALRLHGWMFHLATGVIHTLDPASGAFRPLD